MNTIYINGIAYERCGSEYFHKRCADRAGHDGQHHCGYLWWTTTEATATSASEPATGEYHGVTCSHPHNLPYNDECSVWWLRGTPAWRLAHTNLAK